MFLSERRFLSRVKATVFLESWKRVGSYKIGNGSEFITLYALAVMKSDTCIAYHNARQFIKVAVSTAQIVPVQSPGLISAFGDQNSNGVSGSGARSEIRKHQQTEQQETTGDELHAWAKTLISDFRVYEHDADNDASGPPHNNLSLSL